MKHYQWGIFIQVLQWIVGGARWWTLWALGMTIFYIQWPSSNISTHINGWCVFILHISFLFCPHCVGRSNRYDSFIWITMDIPLFILSSCPTPYMFPFFSLYVHCHGLTFNNAMAARPMAGAAMYICSFAPCHITTPPFTTMTSPTMTEKTWWSRTTSLRNRKKLPVHRASARRRFLGDVWTRFRDSR